jgi:two-component system chemotaxis response regulator CheB
MRVHGTTSVSRSSGRNIAVIAVMLHRDVVVVGASSGGVEALAKLVAGLPEDFPAAVFIVLHVRPDRPSQLPAILNRHGHLPVAHAVDEEPVRRGRIYIAPPAVQTYIHRGRISVSRGPVENNHRPAIDPLFRTAAHYYGPRVIGVVLTGALDDGAAGLAAVKAAGGMAVVQDPADAAFPEMPTHALELVDADYRARIDEIPGILIGLVSVDATDVPMRREIPLETVEEATTPDEASRSDQLGKPSDLTCPDCQGTLYEVENGNRIRFRCRVGHAYSEDAITRAQGDSVERALWSALRVLEERSALMKKLAGFAQRRGHRGVAELYRQRMDEVETDVKALHSLILNGGSLEPVGHEPV